MKHGYRAGSKELAAHLAKFEYIEGPEATKNFERVARAVFQATKKVAPKVDPKKQVSRRKSGKAGG